MKKVLLLLVLFSITRSYAQDENTQIIANATKWLNAYYKFDIPVAMQYSTNDTKTFLNTITQMLEKNPMPNELTKTFEKTRIAINPESVLITKEEAIVSYTLFMPPKAKVPPLEKVIKMKKIQNKWLIQYTLVDAMAENQQIQFHLQE